MECNKSYCKKFSPNLHQICKNMCAEVKRFGKSRLNPFYATGFFLPPPENIRKPEDF